MINDVKKEAEQKMQRGIEAFKEDLRKLRTGRAHAGLLEHVMVEYYGTHVPVKQTANISVEDARTLAGGIFPSLAGSIASEDPKRIRELVRQTATRDDRRLAPREIEAVATAAQEIRTALEPLRAELEKSSGSKKGAITKHLHKLLDQLLAGEELSGDDAELIASVDAKNLDRAREIGNGLLRDVLERADADASDEQVRELAYDLCLVEGARKEDLEIVQQWATKVKEMVADIESRREDAREAAVEGVRRLHQMEIAFGPFETTVRVGIPFDREGVSANLEDGLLEVRLPKRRPVRVEVESE